VAGNCSRGRIDPTTRCAGGVQQGLDLAPGEAADRPRSVSDLWSWLVFITRRGREEVRQQGIEYLRAVEGSTSTCTPLWS
jgi:hypothetical protein